MLYVVVLTVLSGCIAFALVHEMGRVRPRPAGLRGHLRARGWGLLLLPVAVMAAAADHGHAFSLVEIAAAGGLVTWAPRLAAKVVPYALLALAFGLWLLLRVGAPGAGLLRALVSRWRDPRRGGITPALGLLLIPVTAMALLLALANVTKHAGARSVHVTLSHAAGVLRAEVTDDGAGGADPAGGTGLAGVERRLATFDGILAVSSPPGGPTIVVIEVPCASSSAKTSSC